MITEQDIQKAVFKIVSENKIPYTAEGLEFLNKELDKELNQVKYEIHIQPLEEMSAYDRAARRAPKVTVSIK